MRVSFIMIVAVSLLLQFQLFYSFVVVQIIVVVLWWQKYTGPNWLHV